MPDCAIIRISRRCGRTEALARQVVIYPGENGYRVAECPSLPGCITQGKTKEEAVTNIREAIQAYVEALEEDGSAAPVVREVGA